MWFPYRIWDNIRSYMSIWKFPYDQVMLELPKCKDKKWEIYTSALIQPRFLKNVYKHPYLSSHNIITYEIYTINED